jgi:hypothetical protein
LHNTITPGDLRLTYVPLSRLCIQTSPICSGDPGTTTPARSRETHRQRLSFGKPTFSGLFLPFRSPSGEGLVTLLFNHGEHQNTKPEKKMATERDWNLN